MNKAPLAATSTRLALAPALNQPLVTSYPICVQVEFEKPNMTLDALLGYGRLLVREQENVRRVQLAESYMSGAELAGTDGSSIPDELMEEIYERKAEEEKKQAKAGGSLLG